MLSPHFEVRATLYYRVHDAELYGGPGSTGLAKQAFELLPDAQLGNFDDAMATSCRAKLQAYEDAVSRGELVRAPQGSSADISPAVAGPAKEAV